MMVDDEMVVDCEMVDDEMFDEMKDK